jgi:hypothetical protein
MNLRRFAVAALITARAAVAAEDPVSFDYLHIEANSGAASGGHAAVCFAESCFHFQHTPGGLIRLHRDSAGDLDHTYRVLENRTIHVRRVPLSTRDYERLHAAFDSLYRTQARQFEVLEALKEETQFLEMFAARQEGRSPVPTLHLPATAFFVADEERPRPAEGSRSVLVKSLAARLRRIHGNDALSRRAAALQAELRHLAYTPAALPPLQRDAWPRRPVGLAQRQRELATAMVAVEALRSASSPRQKTLRSTGHDEFSLDADEVRTLRAYATRLRESLTRLFSSPRPDWGYPMLVGMARLHAVEASVRSQRLVVVDVFREDAALVDAQTLSQHAGVFSAMREERRQDLVATRLAFFADANADELHWSRLETAANRFIEIDAALRHGRPLRLHHQTLVPAGSARRRDWPLPDLTEAQVAAATEQARRQERMYATELKSLYPYDLLRRNCVTELLRTIDAALGDGGPDRKRARPGAARLAVDGTLNFIPFVAARALQGQFAAVEAIERPSYRRTEVGRMQQRENPTLVRMRESNVFTSRVYAHNGDDGAFLFFTDDEFFLRPLLGVANLAFGLATTVAGTVTLPLDGGTTALAGIEGALFSFPEIAFVALRKGSFAFAPRSWARNAHDDA